MKSFVLMLVSAFALLIFVALVVPEDRDNSDSPSKQIQENSESVEMGNYRFECFDGLCMSTYGTDCDTPADTCDTIIY